MITFNILYFCIGILDYFMNIEVEEQTSNVNKGFETAIKIVESLKKILAEDKQQKQPLFLKIKDDFVFKMARKAVEMKKHPLVIGIAGESASGKTTFVQHMVNALIPKDREDVYTIIPCDNYYHDMAQQLKDLGGYDALFATGFSFDTPAAINLDLMKEHLLKLKAGESIVCPDYDFVTCASNPNGELKKPNKILLNEGLYVLNDGLKEIMDVKVYVFTPFDVIKERWYKRAAIRGKSGHAADVQFANVNETAQTYIRPTLEISDIVINGLVSAEYISEITGKIYREIKSAVAS